MNSKPSENVAISFLIALAVSCLVLVALASIRYERLNRQEVKEWLGATVNEDLGAGRPHF